MTDAAQAPIRVLVVDDEPLAREKIRGMAAADLTCLPSYSEGCPNVVVESLACGRAARTWNPKRPLS